MKIVIELPPSVEEELSIEARREGVTPAEHATFFLYLATALTGEGEETPFRAAVRSFFAHHRIDLERVASACDQLRKLCLEGESRADHDASEGSFQIDGLETTAAQRSHLLKAWRDEIVHRPAKLIITSPEKAHDPAHQTSRTARPSIRGKYAYIGLSSEDHAREKQLEIEREDRI